MKTFFIVLGLLLTTATGVVTASESESNDESFRQQWTCTGYGTLNVGGPAGPIVMSVYGHGDTQLEAITDAQQRCFSQGLQRCMVSNCYKH